MEVWYTVSFCNVYMINVIVIIVDMYRVFIVFYRFYSKISSEMITLLILHKDPITATKKKRQVTGE